MIVPKADPLRWRPWAVDTGSSRRSNPGDLVVMSHASCRCSIPLCDNHRTRANRKRPCRGVAPHGRRIFSQRTGDQPTRRAFWLSTSNLHGEMLPAKRILAGTTDRYTDRPRPVQDAMAGRTRSILDDSEVDAFMAKLLTQDPILFLEVTDRVLLMPVRPWQAACWAWWPEPHKKLNRYRSIKPKQ